MAVVSNVEIRVDARNAIKQLDSIQSKSSRLPGGFKKGAVASKGLAGGLATAGTAAKGMGAALGAALAPLLAIGAAVGAVTKSFTVMGERQADLAALENGLKNLGVTSDQVLTALQTKADEFGKVTLFSQEDYTKAATQLTSFTNISVASFDRVINVAGDVAQVMGQDVSSATTQLAKALNAPTQNLSALSRSGIQFTEQQKAQIKALESSGQLQKAQGVILAELERQYKGAAVAAGSAGLAGALDGLSEVANDAFEAFGKMLEPIAVPIIQGITRYVQFMSDTWAYISSVIFPEIVAAAKPLTDALGRVFSGVDIQGFGTVLQNVVIAGFKILAKVIGVVSKVLGFVIDRFADLGKNPVFKFIAEQVGKLVKQLGLTKDRVGEFNDAQRTSQGEADKILAKQNQITGAVDQTAQSQEQVNAALSRQNQLISQAAKTQTTASSQTLELAESQANVAKIRAQSELQIAEAAGDVEGAYKARVKIAEIDYDIAIKRIRAAVEQKRIAFEEAKAKEKALRQAIANNAQNEALVEKLRNQLALQIADTDQKGIAYNFSKKLAESQEKVAAETKKAAIQSAELARNTAKAADEAGRNAKNTAKANNNAAKLTTNFVKARKPLTFMSNATMSVSTNMTAITRELEKQFALQDAAAATGLSEEYFELAEQAKRFREEIKRVTWKDAFGNVVNKQMINDLKKGLELTIRKMNELKEEAMETNAEMQKLGNSASRTAALVNQAANGNGNGAAKQPYYYAPAGIYAKPAYASGGYVSSPTDAVIGEGGSEYVIPASKMAAAMERYASGKRGNEVVPNGNDTQVNVSTGPVMQMNGQNYVTQSDFEKGLRSTVNQVMTTLRRSPNTRAAVGI